MLDINGLKEALKKVASSNPSGITLTGAIVTYVRANGVPKGATISYNLGPASGVGWELLKAKASSSGVANYIVSDWLSTEFSGSMKVIPAPSGTAVVPMSFDKSVKVPDMSGYTDYDQCWASISKAIIEFFKPEIE